MNEPHPPTTLDSAASSIASLRARFDGRVIDRDDPRYDQARKVFAGGIGRFPAVIVRPTIDDLLAATVAAIPTSRPGQC